MSSPKKKSKNTGKILTKVTNDFIDAFLLEQTKKVENSTFTGIQM